LRYVHLNCLEWRFGSGPPDQLATNGGGPDGQGVSVEKGFRLNGVPPRTSNGKRRSKGADIRRRRLGQKIFLTTALDANIPGRPAGVTHKMSDGTDFVHPDAVGATSNTPSSRCLDRDAVRSLGASSLQRSGL